jgi:hypothetical protein
MDKDLQKAIERLKSVKYSKDSNGKKFWGDLTFKLFDGIIAVTEVRQVYKDGEK